MQARTLVRGLGDAVRSGGKTRVASPVPRGSTPGDGGGGQNVPIGTGASARSATARRRLVGLGLGVALVAIGLVLTLLQIVLGGGDIVSAIIANAISILISLAILYYLFQPHVKAAFGRA